MTAQREVNLYCPHCESTEIKRDAWAEWDPSKMDWVLGDVFDDMWCESCEEQFNEAKEEEVDIEDGQE